MTLNSDIAKAIELIMNDQGLTLRKAADKLGRSHNWLGLKLRGQSPLNLDDLEEIGRGLGFDPASLVHDTAQTQDQVD